MSLFHKKLLISISGLFVVGSVLVFVFKDVIFQGGGDIEQNVKAEVILPPKAPDQSEKDLVTYRTTEIDTFDREVTTIVDNKTGDIIDEEIRTKAEVDIIEQKIDPATALYLSSYEALLDNRPYKAAKGFIKLETTYPYFKDIEYAKVLKSYALYKYNEVNKALESIKDFAQLYPRSKYVPYLHYLRSMIYYEEIWSTDWDQVYTRNADASFEQLISKYPNTDYAIDASLKMSFVNSQKALDHLKVGLQYQMNKNYGAAIARYNKIVSKFDKTLYVREALYRLVTSYISIGLYEEARKVGLVLGLNYPKSRWYSRAYSILEEKGLL